MVGSIDELLRLDDESLQEILKSFCTLHDQSRMTYWLGIAVLSGFGIENKRLQRILGEDFWEQISNKRADFRPVPVADIAVAQMALLQHSHQWSRQHEEGADPPNL